MGRLIDFSEQVIGGGTASFPDQTNNSGKVLVTNGTEVFWGIANSITVDGGLSDSTYDQTTLILDGGNANGE
jgi:hypothetical protein